MEINVDNRSGQELPVERIEELALFVLEREGIRKTAELSLSFVEPDEITELNTRYRAKPEPTDVLSFELDNPWDETAQEDTGQLLLGDIVICPDIAKEHACLEEVSLEEELWILVIHGILHLLGYDHADEDEALLMEKKEDDYFLLWEARVGI